MSYDVFVVFQILGMTTVTVKGIVLEIPMVMLMEISTTMPRVSFSVTGS